VFPLVRFFFFPFFFFFFFFFFISDPASKSYTSKGSVGVAIVKEVSSRHFQLITYYTPQSQLAVVDLNTAFVFTLQADGYGTYTASSGHTWSLKFASVEAAAEFAQQVALGKSAGGGFRDLAVQDLVAGSGYQVKEGDIVGVTYTAWLVADNKLAKQIDSNAGKVKKVVLGNDRASIAGWHQAIPGMRKGGVRFLVVPPHLAYGPEGARPLVPPNAVLAFRLELLKVKKGSAPLAAGGSASPGDSESASRGHIIDRMKNIAVQAWPAAAAPERQDDSAEEQSANVETLAVYQPKEASMPLGVKEQMEAMRLQMEKMKQDAEVERRVREAEEKAREAERKAKEAEEKVKAVPQQQQQQQMLMQSGLVQPYMGQQGYYAPPQQHMQHQHQAQPPQQQGNVGLGAKDAVEVYVESKEWRKTMDITLNAIHSKVDVVHSRIENSFLSAKSGQEEALTGGNLIKALRRLIDENDTRGAELKDKNERLDSLRSTIAQLHEKNEKLLDERNKMLEYRNDAVRETTDASRKQLDGLREEKDRLDKELLTVQDKLAKNKRKLASLVRTHETLKAELDMVKDELIKTKDELQRQTSARTTQAVEVEDLKAQLKKEREARRTIELDRGRLAEQLEEEQQSTKRLQASIDARKAGYEEQKERMERLAAEEKEALRKELAQLNDTLRQERLSAGSITQEQKQKMEEAENKHRIELARELAAAKEGAARNVQNRMEVELAEAVRAAEAKARSEARAAFHADNPLAPEVKELKTRLAGAEDSLQRAIGEHKVVLAKAELAQRAAAASNPQPGSQISEVEVSRKIVAQTKGIMSKVYFVVVQSIPADQQILGKEVHARVLNCIKTVTSQVLAPLEGGVAAGQASPAAAAAAAAVQPAPATQVHAAPVVPAHVVVHTAAAVQPSAPVHSEVAPNTAPAVVAVTTTPVKVSHASMEVEEGAVKVSHASMEVEEGAVVETAPRATEAMQKDEKESGEEEPVSKGDAKVDEIVEEEPIVAEPVKSAENGAGGEEEEQVEKNGGDELRAKDEDWDKSDGENVPDEELAAEPASVVLPVVAEGVVVAEEVNEASVGGAVIEENAESPPVEALALRAAPLETQEEQQSEESAPSAPPATAVKSAPFADVETVSPAPKPAVSSFFGAEDLVPSPAAVKPSQSSFFGAEDDAPAPAPAKPATPAKSSVASGLWGDDDVAVPAPAPAGKVAVKQNFSSLFADDEDVAVATPEKKAETPKSANKSAALFDDEDEFLAKPKAKGGVDDSLFKF
jgi:hypothetical protein